MGMVSAKGSERRSLDEVHASVPTGGRNPFSRLFAFLGPAYLVSVGYMDPGNWATDLGAGAQFGYALVWVLLMSNLMAVLLQTLSARLGVVTGHDLARLGLEPGPLFKTLLAAVREAQLDGTVRTPGEGLALVNRLLDERKPQNAEQDQSDG